MKSLRLSEERVREHMEAVLMHAEGRWIRYSRGFMTDGEWYEMMQDVLIRAGVISYLEKNGLYMDLDPEKGLYDAFKAELEAFHKGAWTSQGSLSSWLFPIRGKEAADPEDHRLALFLTEGLHLRAECFMPFQTKAPAPGNIEGHSWHDCRAFCLDFGCTDDGGLLTDPAPAGRTFTLTGRYGLKAVLTIKENQREGCGCLNAQFPAEGSIEGYTADVRTGSPDVLIRASCGKVKYLFYYEFPEDWKAMRHFPLWKQYFEERQIFFEERHRIRKDTFLELCRTFSEQASVRKDSGQEGAGL